MPCTLRLGGFTYEEMLLNPIADALAAALSPRRRVWMAMQVSTLNLALAPAPNLTLHNGVAFHYLFCTLIQIV